MVKILIEHGKMTEYGLAAIEHAKQHGTWETPKREPISAEQINLLIQALSGAEKAVTNFLHMPLSVQRTYTAHYLDAKKEDTRTKRLEQIIERLNANQKPM